MTIKTIHISFPDELYFKLRGFAESNGFLSDSAALRVLVSHCSDINFTALKQEKNIQSVAIKEKSIKTPGKTPKKPSKNQEWETLKDEQFNNMIDTCDTCKKQCQKNGMHWHETNKSLLCNDCYLQVNNQ